MKKEKVLEVIGIYRKYFEEKGIPIKDMNSEKLILDYANPDLLAHCHRMLDKMEGFIDEGRMDKVFRWLGFIQGVLLSAGFYTLDDLKNHSRPSEG